MYNTWKVIAALFFDRYVQKVKRTNKTGACLCWLPWARCCDIFEADLLSGDEGSALAAPGEGDGCVTVGPFIPFVPICPSAARSVLAGLSSKSMAVWTC